MICRNSWMSPSWSLPSHIQWGGCQFIMLCQWCVDHWKPWEMCWSTWLPLTLRTLIKPKVYWQMSDSLLQGCTYAYDLLSKHFQREHLDFSLVQPVIKGTKEALREITVHPGPAEEELFSSLGGNKFKGDKLFNFNAGSRHFKCR